MSSQDVAPPCARCRELTGRVIRHFPDQRHYGRFLRLLVRLRLLRRR